jgi:glycosyltransferase involved in cell wall biosynthesis
MLERGVKGLDSPQRMKQETPLVSVIINCFNGETFLSDALNSVLAQTYQNWEIIFWDNQSTDNSKKIFKQYSDKRFKYFFGAKHVVLYEARNQAIKVSSGSLISFLDVDDIWLPDKLILQVALFQNPNVGFACGNYWIKHENKKTLKLAIKRRIPEGDVTKALLNFYSVGMLTLVLRRSAIERYDSVFDRKFQIIGDADLVIRMAKEGWKMASIQFPIAVYRIHERSQTKQMMDLHLEELSLWTKTQLDKGPVEWGKAYKYLGGYLYYLEAINALMENRRLESIKIANKMNWGVYKARIIILNFLPRGLIKFIKN